MVLLPRLSMHHECTLPRHVVPPERHLTRGKGFSLMCSFPLDRQPALARRNFLYCNFISIDSNMGTPAGNRLWEGEVLP